MNSDQGNLLDKAFDPALAEKEGQRGREQALGSTYVEAWTATVTRWIEGLWPGAKITADSVTKAIGLPTERDLYAKCNNALGALFTRLSKKGTLRMVGFTKSSRVSSRGRTIRVWERT